MTMKVNKNVSRLMDSFDKLSLQEKLKANFLMADKIKDSFSKEFIDIGDFSLDFTLEDIESIISKYGSQMKKLQYLSSFDDATNNKYAEIFAKYCENLEEIHMKGFEITVDNVLGHLLKASKHVKKLRLNDCILGNASCPVIACLTLLEILDLENSTITGKDFNLLSNLVELNLKNCKNFKSEIYVQMCSRNTLKKLNIIGFVCFSDTDLSKFIDKLSKLENLSVGTKYRLNRYERICKIGSLREINIINSNEHFMEKEVMENYFVVLTELHKENLLAINIESMQTNFDIKKLCFFKNMKALGLRDCSLNYLDLVTIAKSCRKLEMLDLYDIDFTEPDLLEVVECMTNLRFLDITHSGVCTTFYGRLVESRRIQRLNQQLLIFIDRRMILAEMLTSEYYCENQDYIKLIVKEMRSHGDTSMLDCLASLKIQYPEPVKIVNEKLSTKSLTSRRHIFDLNNDCLQEIFKYLSNLEMLLLILTTNRFDDIIQEILEKSLIEIASLAQFLTLREAREILYRSGHMMKSFVIQFSSDKVLKFTDLLVKHCSNIQGIVFDDKITQTFEKQAAKLIKVSAKTLKSISISTDLVSEIIEQEIAKLKNLENLAIDYPLTGRILEKMKKLTVLYIQNRHKIEVEYLNKVFRTNQLKKLHLCSPEGSPVTSLRVLVETQKNLENLGLFHICGDASFYDIPKIKSLRHVRFFDCNPHRTVMALQLLSESIGNQIKSIIIYFLQEIPATLHSLLLLCISKFPNLGNLELATQNKFNIECYEKILKSCSRLEILNIPNTVRLGNITFDSSAMALDSSNLIMAIEMLHKLRHLFVGKLDSEKAEEIVKIAYKIKVERNDTVPLIIHLINNVCQHFFDTQEYKVMDKHVALMVDKHWATLNEDLLMEKQPIIKARNHCYIDRPSLDLPDDCLREIASKLSNIDKLSFAFTNKRILNAIKPIASEIIFDINAISRVFRLSEAKKLFYELREYIHCFEYSITERSNPVAYIKLIEPFTKNFRQVVIGGGSENLRKYNTENLFILPEQKLEKLCFENVDRVDHILNKIIEKQNSGLNPLKNLTDLSFFGSRISPSQFNVLCRNCHLKNLAVQHCVLLNDENFKVLLETQNDYLESLGISGQYPVVNLESRRSGQYPNTNFTNVSRLSNLKHISILLLSYSKDFEILFGKLIKYRRYDLLTLEITMIPDNWVDCSKVNRLLEEKRGKFANLQKFTFI